VLTTTPPTTLPYEVVDVFTTGGAFTGNPLAVVLDADDLSTAQLQTLAREFNLSETTFPLPSQDGDYRLRIFTPGRELPFAGHPSIGAAWLLGQLGRLELGDRVQDCLAGLLPVTVDATGARLTGAEPTLTEPIDPEPWITGLGLTAEDLDGEVREAGTGTPFTIVTLGSRDAVDRSRPGDLPGQVFVVHRDGDRAHARMFAPGFGIAEDPATGSAVLGWGVLLRHQGFTGTVTVAQGVAMGRPSRLVLDVGVQLTVAGTCARVAAGAVHVPPAP
jgi:trans-2,3-dihydro-3-hydroxyanthranilate isomerase